MPCGVLLAWLKICARVRVRACSELLEAVERLRCDMIVVGIFGRCATKLLRCAPPRMRREVLAGIATQGARARGALENAEAWCFLGLQDSGLAEHGWKAGPGPRVAAQVLCLVSCRDAVGHDVSFLFSLNCAVRLTKVVREGNQPRRGEHMTSIAIHGGACPPQDRGVVLPKSPSAPHIHLFGAGNGLTAVLERAWDAWDGTGQWMVAGPGMSAIASPTQYRHLSSLLESNDN